MKPSKVIGLHQIFQLLIAPRDSNLEQPYLQIKRFVIWAETEALGSKFQCLH